MFHIAMLDSDAFCLKGLQEYFTLNNLRTVGCSSLYQLETILETHRINVVMSELSTEEDNLFACMDYFKTLKRRRPTLQLVFFTRLNDPALIAYVRKTLPDCKVAFKNESLLNLSLSMMSPGLQHEVRRSDNNEFPQDILTPREFYLLRFLSQGKCHKDISRSLPLSIKTISYYKLKIMEKLKCRTAADFQKRMHNFGVYDYLRG